MLHTALRVAGELESLGLKVGVVDIFDIVNFDVATLIELIKSYQGIVTLEEGFRGRGGLDAKLFELLSRSHLTQQILNIGVEGGYRFELGSREELHEQVGIGPKVSFMNIKNFIESL